MGSKTVTLASATGGASSVAASFMTRKGDVPTPPQADPDWTPHNSISANPRTYSYGDDHNPYVDAISLTWQLQGNQRECEFRTYSRGDQIDNALNGRDTFSVTVDGTNVSVACTNSNGIGDTLTLTGTARND